MQEQDRRRTINSVIICMRIEGILNLYIAQIFGIQEITEIDKQTGATLCIRYERSSMINVVAHINVHYIYIL